VGFLFWDASALAKRYTPEVGSDAVDAFFREHPIHYHLTTVWSYAETYSILCRKRNDRQVTDDAFYAAANALEQDVMANARFHLLPVEE
jgi:hypothetical protein